MTTSSEPLVWLITGCSSGLGLGLAMTALKAGHKVVATSRNPDKTPELVKQVESAGGKWLKLDMTFSEDEMKNVTEQVTKEFGRIDVLVNNASTAIMGPLEDISEEEARKVMDTNFFGPFRLIRSVLPVMRKQQSGTIVSISGATGVGPGPAMGLLGASKWALEGMSQGLAAEVAPFNIRVLIVQPGSYSTNLFSNARASAKPLTSAYEETPTGMLYKKFAGEADSRNIPTVNDVEKGCQAMFEVITKTGRGVGKEHILRLPLGADCATRTKDQIARYQEGYDSFQDIWQNVAK